MVRTPILCLLTTVMAVWSSFAAAADEFDTTQSAALFVGVRQFPYDTTLADVRYAVDDAIDLAFLLAMDGRVRLIDPSRMILALSGNPQKLESQQNLERLVAAGAQVRSAGQADVLTALDEQARKAGKSGVLVLAFATHGVSYDGTQYLLTASSVVRHRETMLSESKIRDIASKSDATRCLILVDACRERLSADRRSGGPDVRSAASLIQAMSRAHGQVVLSAAAAGQYAYDDEVRRNGVFTAAVIDGLRCNAPMDARGLVTVDALAAFVERQVSSWIRKNRDANIVRATQMTSDGDAKTMPLASCKRSASAPASGASKPPQIAPEPISATQPVLFREHFDDNRNQWKTSNDPLAPSLVVDGVYKFGSRMNARNIATVPVAFDPGRDFEIRCTVRKTRGLNGYFYGLIWGFRDENHFFNLAITASGHVAVTKIENGFTDYMNTAPENPHVHQGDDINRLKIQRRGGQLRFMVNDHLVHEMPFVPFFGDRLGFIVWQDIHLTFDDLEVEQAPLLK